MKYIPVQETIPQSKRQEFNEKIVYLIDSDTAVGAGITKEDIYNAYTGDGGLHGLERSMFDSYAKYSEAKKEVENGQFFTPPYLCKFITDCLQVDKEDVDLDEIYEKFGVDYDLLALLMYQEEDEEGHFKIRWGEQKIS